MRPSEDPTATQILVSQIQSGDEKALGTLYQRYLARVRRWSQGRLNNNARGVTDTDGLAHDVLSRVLLRIPTLRPAHELSFKAYLRASVSNAIIKVNQRSPLVPVDFESATLNLSAADPDPLELQVCRQFEERLVIAFNGLEHRDQQLILSRHVENLSHAEVARRLGLESEDAARMASRRAYDRMKKRILFAVAS